MAIHFRNEILNELREMWNLLVEYTICDGKKEELQGLFNTSPMKDIIQFKLYKVYCRRTGAFDYDCCDKAMEMISALLTAKGVTGKITCKTDKKRQPNIALRRDIHFPFGENNDNSSFDTDTIHSLDGMLNNFFRAADKNYIQVYSTVDGKDYMIRNGIKYFMLSAFDSGERYFWPKAFTTVNENNRDLWLALIVDEVYNHYLEQQCHRLADAMTLLNDWASVVDTIGNIMIGPTGFNATTSNSHIPHSKCKLGFNCFNDNNINHQTEAIDVFFKHCENNDKDWYNLILKTLDLQLLHDYFEENTDAPIQIPNISKGNQVSGDFRYELNRIMAICKLINDRTKNIEDLIGIGESSNSL